MKINKPKRKEGRVIITVSTNSKDLKVIDDFCNEKGLYRSGFLIQYALDIIKNNKKQDVKQHGEG